MVHISEVANTFVSEIKDHLTEGQTVTVTYSPYVNESGDKVFGKNNVSAVEHTDNPMETES